MKLPNNKKFEVLRFSDGNYEKLTAEIRFLGEPIAQINQDKGKDSLELELFADFGDADFILKFPLDDFLQALNYSRATLIE